MRRVLELTFKTSTEKTFTLQIQNPKADLTKEFVEQAMNKIMKLNLFNLSKGELVSIHSAQYIERNTRPLIK
ncbi:MULTISPECIES: DUF2922 domain-containing protein [Mammaliicoccus]|uniref:DUF2922 domain-containing protein n=1 Tax=Mammaliicoccus fleurettii TaxID=150056 RepID=A0ABS5MM67_9STAP|nr:MULTISPECIES: DUF2922 domain-containing protein [Mammaliicoccus]MBL0847265.1 DUF2922 domain-containing protein [Mammaliicoccus fleurettii]MBO3061592.1 DUF2922 domain-containing protein [Mammaliicoccus fleurettii]MBS3672089.1 DUF2922 domain-containing protein [Mammaliicoccus fleurettii]MBS3697015.1 DUF2922 domain-containing protein [Mammaliicoccus fleurettii]MBW0765432.1 DUF2922 domain-containing protein [Mammaliicoccus fleurettii]